jgi:PPP family 3-phenylpropionic acid transporter
MPTINPTALRLALMYAALFVIFGVQVTYLPVWLDARGLTAAEISFALSTPMFVRILVTPSLAVWADRAQSHKSTVVVLCATGLAIMLLLSVLEVRPLVVALVIVMLTAMGSIMPFADAITLAAVRAGAGLQYGRIRLWGSLTFVLASYAAGFAVAATGPNSIIWLLVAGAAMTTVAASMVQSPSGESSTRRRAGFGDLLATVRDRGFLLLLISAGLIQASHAMLYTFGVLHWRAQGLSPGFIGTLWAVGVFAEIILFWVAGKASALGATGLMLIGGLSALVRWTAMAFDPSPALLVPLQVLHAGTFASTHLGAMQWISTNVPSEKSGTAQALLATSTGGIAMSTATLASGPLYEAFAGASYIAMTIMGVAGLLAVAMLARNGEKRAGD